MAMFDTIDNILDKRIHQVIGSTPESLRSTCEGTNMKNNPDVAAKFVALSVLAAAVNKETIGKAATEADFMDLAMVIRSGFYLNGTVNMTALSLAGHCFVASDKFSKIRFVAEFRKKMGQDNLWDGNFDSGSISAKQKEIFIERKKAQDRKKCVDFADWFVSWSGLDQKLRTGTRAEAATRGRGGSSVPSRRGREILQPEGQASASATLPEDLVHFYFNEVGKTQADLDDAVGKHGLEKIIRSIRHSYNEAHPEFSDPVDDGTVVGI
jgi:hypothetical protein